MLVTAAVAAVLAGCGAPGELRSSGPTPGASAPVRLWPDHTPSPPPPPPGDAPANRPSRVNGVPEVPSDDIRDANALRIVQRDVADTQNVTGSDALDDQTRQRVRDCPEDCPVRTPAYHDLTGDGKADLIVAIDMDAGYLSVRAYALRNKKVVRILSTVDVSSAVEVSDQQLTMRSPDQAAGFENATFYGWDGWNKGMVYLGNLLLEVKPAPTPSRKAPTSPNAAPGPTKAPRTETTVPPVLPSAAPR
ncbi:lipoprotein [Wenjunlia tyrosinilytica]|uniref:Lipoprotein n=1 Tax=Wenjunlia tyrosinilytica TaxID=1544741 RepID=A0A918DW66_9ACTN|nr:lipoprotein [Wenjunlia tyrosinilytica]